MQPSDRVNINWNPSPVLNKNSTFNKYEATWSNGEKTYTITVGISNGLSLEYVKNIIEEQFKEFKDNDMYKLAKNKFSYDPLKNDRESETFSDISNAAAGKTEITLKWTESYFERLTGWLTGMFSPVEGSDFTIEVEVIPSYTFELLPDEMVLSMLKKFSVKEIVRMREVDTRFRDIGGDALVEKICNENISLKEQGLKGNSKILDFLNSLHPVNRLRIKRLNLSGTCISDWFLAILSSLIPNLQDLNLEGCDQITDEGLQHLVPFTQLRNISLMQCFRITAHGLKFLAPLTELRSLNLACCSRITGEGLNYITSLKKLEKLSLWDCNKITNDGLKNLALFTELRSLNLAWCYDITDDGLQHLAPLTQLRRLSLPGCSRITDDGLQHLAPLKKLENLNIFFCYNITYAGRNALKRHIPGLKFLEMHDSVTVSVTS